MGIGNKILHSIHKTDGEGLLEALGAATPTIPTLASGETYTTTLNGTVLAAAVQTLNATPVSVLAAPGANQYAVVNWARFTLVHNGVDYDAAGAGEDLTVRYTNGSGAEVITAIDHSGFGDASADAIRFTRGASDFVPVANAALVMHIKSGEWYSAAGDGDIEYAINVTVHTTV